MKNDPGNMIWFKETRSLRNQLRLQRLQASDDKNASDNDIQFIN